MRVLGISEIDNDAGAALFIDGRLAGAASEERFSRRKRHAGFPRLTVRWLLDAQGLSARDLDLVVIVKPEGSVERRLNAAPVLAHDWHSHEVPALRRWLEWLAYFGWKIPHNRFEIRRYDAEIRAWLDAEGVPGERVLRAPHHRAHAASAYFSSGFPRALVVTLDGQGGGISASVWRGDGAELDLIHAVSPPHSLGFFYALVTRALGFKPGRHEGKVTGLAACAPPSPRALALFRQIAHVSGEGFVTPGLYGAYPELRTRIRDDGAAPVAAAAQLVLEEVVTAWVARHLAATGETRVALAGGVFGNVKLNQRIAEIAGVEEVWVFPHMGDGGLAYGGVLDLLAARDGRKPEAIRDVYWGPSYPAEACEEALRRAGLVYSRPRDLSHEVAELLARGKTVGRADGAMEFGPRALGNRSILYQATDRSVNDWLNQRLHRTEFMPFAPATLAAAAPGSYERFEPGRRAAEFMTMTFACVARLRDEAPAVVHVDGTARPQVVRAEVNPEYHALIEAYRRKTGHASVINTSFNMHEEPIVLSPGDAIRAAIAARLDALVLGPYLSVREGR